MATVRQSNSLDVPAPIRGQLFLSPLSEYTTSTGNGMFTSLDPTIMHDGLKRMNLHASRILRRYSETTKPQTRSSSLALQNALTRMSVHVNSCKVTPIILETSPHPNLSNESLQSLESSTNQATIYQAAFEEMCWSSSWPNYRDVEVIITRSPEGNETVEVRKKKLYRVIETTGVYFLITILAIACIVRLGPVFWW